MVCAALAVFLAFVLYFGWWGGALGSALTDVLRYLLGLLAYAIPPLLVYGAAVLLAGPSRRPLPAATAGLAVLCAAFVLAAAADTFGVFPGSRPKDLFVGDYLRSHGGAAGELLWAGVGFLLGRIGTAVLVVATAVVGVLLISGSSLGAWLSHSRRGATAATRFAKRSAQTLHEQGRASTEALQARLGARRAQNATLVARDPIEDATQYMPGVTIHAPRLIDGARDAPELYHGMASVPVEAPIEHEVSACSVEAEKEAAATGDDQLSLRTLVNEASEPGAAAFAPVPSARVWTLPDPALLRRLGGNAGETTATIDEVSRRLVTTLESFGVQANVVNTVTGPRVTRYELQLAPGIKVSRVTSLKADLAYSLAATDVRVLAPIPGKTAVGVEVPNVTPSFVALGDVYGPFPHGASPLACWLGKDITGKAVLADLRKMVHLLVAGTTGSGKSACINCIISSILLRATPEQVRMILIDPKKVELSNFDGIPHLLTPVVTDPRKAGTVLMNIVHEMERRYDLMSNTGGAQSLKDLNRMREKQGERPLPYILLVIDELADLMMVAPNDVEHAITRLGQLGRAAGVHMVVATQRPSVDVITGLIKSNIPWRIAFAVASQTDSRVILDQGGAETLLGEGDMLFGPSGSPRMLRVQGAFVEQAEMALLTSHWRAQAAPELRTDLLETAAQTTSGEAAHGALEDELLPDAITTVVNTGAASVALLQRRLRVGYARAGRLIDMMEEQGIISGFDGSKARNVLIDEAALPRVLAEIRGEPQGDPGAGKSAEDTAEWQPAEATE